MRGCCRRLAMLFNFGKSQFLQSFPDYFLTPDCGTQFTLYPQVGVIFCAKLLEFRFVENSSTQNNLC